MKSSCFKDIRNRFVASSVMAFFVLVALLLVKYSVGQALIFLEIATLGGGALGEYLSLLTKKGVKPLPSLIPLLGGLCFLECLFLGGQLHLWSVSLCVWGALLLSMMLFISHFDDPRGGIVCIACKCFAVLYIGAPSFAFIGLLYFFDQVSWGAVWLFYLICVVKGADVGAYFVGRSLGKRTFLPHISPQKTVEGALGGLGLAVSVSVFFFFVSSRYSDAFLNFSWQEALFLGLGLGVLSQVGDLSESLLKRDAGIKDSSFIPGLGGMLDVIDSFIFAAPLLYLYLILYH